MLIKSQFIDFYGFIDIICQKNPLRITPWSKPEIFADKIIELRDFIEVLLPDIEDLDTKQKIINDLKSIKFNF